MLKIITAITLSILLFISFTLSGESISLICYSVLGLIAVTYLINLLRLELSWPHLLLPIFFLLAVGLSYLIITIPALRTVFLVISGLLFYFLEINLGKESYFLQSIFLLSAFGIYSGLFALEFYLNLNIWLILLGVSAFTLLFTLQGFAGFELYTKKNLILLIVLIITESALGLLLWPVYFLVSGAVLFAIFYLLWIFLVSSFFGKLTRNKIYWQLSMVSIFLLIIFISSAWRPLFN
jgi:hypothetical protein